MKRRIEVRVRELTTPQTQNTVFTFWARDLATARVLAFGSRPTREAAIRGAVRGARQAISSGIFNRVPA